MKRKLTQLGVNNLRAPKSGRLEVWDSVLPAFGIRVTEKNARSWIVALRRPGAKHPSRIKLGAPPEMSLVAAREGARGDGRWRARMPDHVQGACRAVP